MNGLYDQTDTISIFKDMEIVEWPKLPEFQESSKILLEIDKETTGVLIVAKNRKYAQLFTTMFRLRKINKIYLCIIKGEMYKPNGTLNDILYYYEGEKKIKNIAITNYKERIGSIQ